MIEEAFSRDLDTNGLAKKLERTFGDEGYKVQEIGGGDDIAVQIKKESTARAVVGLQQAITVRMQKQGSQTKVSVGQAKWADKVGVEAIGAIAFWPLMIPATWGVYKQHTLPQKVIDVVNDYASSNVPNVESKTSLTIACPKCGVSNTADSGTCSACGASLKES